MFCQRNRTRQTLRILRRGNLIDVRLTYPALQLKANPNNFNNGNPTINNPCSENVSSIWKAFISYASAPMLFPKTSVEQNTLAQLLDFL